MFSELTVIIKDDDGKTLKKKYPIYESYTIDINDPIVKGCVENVLKDFASEPSSVSVKVHMRID